MATTKTTLQQKLQQSKALGQAIPKAPKPRGLPPPPKAYSSKLPGCKKPASGMPAMICYLAQQMLDQLHALGQALCKEADRAMAALNKKGIATPSGWSHLSCDQKDALLVALMNPLGIGIAELIVAGGVVVGLAESVIAARPVQDVSNAISHAADQLTGAAADVAHDLGKTAQGVVDTLTSSTTKAGGGHLTVGGHKVF